MTALANTTTYSAEIFSYLDARAQEQRVLIVCATFAVLPDGTTHLSDVSQSPRATDEYYGDPGGSSLMFASDLAPPKRVADVVVRGSAVAKDGRTATELLTRLRMPGLDKRVLVSGNRRWSGDRWSKAEPFARMELQYERAYGGATPFCAENPVGVGAATNGEDHQLPNLEYPNDRMTAKSSRPKPAGYGPIAPWWSPRTQFVGTYDETWLREQSPLLPHDFDDRFFQSAPLDQQLPALTPGMQVELTGMTTDDLWRFRLPEHAPEVRLLFSEQSRRLRLLPDTLLIEPDERRITLTARALLPENRRDPLREIMLGPVTRGRWRSRLTGKPYKTRSD